MYKYSLEKVNKNNLEVYKKLYKDHYGQQVRNADEVVRDLDIYYKDSALVYFCAAILAGHSVSAMAISARYPNHYTFGHLVTHTDHRRLGLARGVLELSVKFLIDIGAETIRNHKRMNVIPHTIFEELGFDLRKFDDSRNNYKWLYQLDVINADIPALEKVWDKY